MLSVEARSCIDLCYQTVGSLVERVAARLVQRIAANVVAWVGVCGTARRGSDASGKKLFWLVLEVGKLRGDAVALPVQVADVDMLCGPR